MNTKMIRSCMVAFVFALFLGSGVSFAQKGGGAKVKAKGQAAIYGDDVANARDRAIQDAQRKAVEQALGLMVSSETLMSNFQLISDEILTKASGYVRGYKILKEGRTEDGIYEVTIKAKVGRSVLKSDLQGVLAILETKNMPRVLVMISEQNVGGGGKPWWQSGGTVSMDAAENTFIDAWRPKGIEFVDRQALTGEISTRGPLAQEPSASEVKTFGAKVGAEVVVVGKAIALDKGAIMNTAMRSVQATLSLRAINVDSGRVLATAIVNKANPHVDPIVGGTLALKKAAEAAAEELLQKILAVWEHEASGPSKLVLKVKNIPKFRVLRTMQKFLGNQVRGMQKIRQRSYRGGVAELEVEFNGSTSDLAIELEEKRFNGYSLEIEEITGNVVIGSLTK
ncbi:MAG: flagellar assembly protein T N-terminal domain-containing protein [Myxococcota bacterium]|nr:flagellar assembly protein T N-terminal domain-containing protein [Myxococcota bacterium]